MTGEAHGRLKAIADSVPALIGYWNPELRCEFSNQAYREWYGIEPRDILGMPMAELLGERIFSLNEPHARAALAGQPQQFERELIKADGSKVLVDARYTPDVDAAGVVRGFCVLVTDITQLRLSLLALESANAKLKSESLTDYLTGLPNRRVFSERSEQALHRFKVSGEPYGLILLDLDNFKRINDEFGHDIGDDVLRTVGRVLQSSLRGRNDMAARLGGEEFAVLCVGRVDEDVLLRIGERIRAALWSEGIRTSRGPIQISGSFGVAIGNTEDADWKNIYGRADAALYEAKAAGKNRVVLGTTYRTGPATRLRSRGFRHQ
jgi:diguanylate cyclase (GGDEF)-like protein/PAS domain S-box-containing protein